MNKEIAYRTYSAIFAQDVIKFFTLRAHSLTVGYIWHNDVQNDFHLPQTPIKSTPRSFARGPENTLL